MASVKWRPFCPGINVFAIGTSLLQDAICSYNALLGQMMNRLYQSTVWYIFYIIAENGNKAVCGIMATSRWFTSLSHTTDFAHTRTGNILLITQLARVMIKECCDLIWCITQLIFFKMITRSTPHSLPGKADNGASLTFQNRICVQSLTLLCHIRWLVIVDHVITRAVAFTCMLDFTYLLFRCEQWF